MPNESIQDEICPLLKLKTMLGRAEEKSAGCAIALTKDKHDFALLVDAKLSAKHVRDKLRDGLENKIDKASIRFGTVAIDKENDPGTVKFSLNKSAPGGTLPLLVKLIKKAGYQGVALNEDPSLEGGDLQAPAAGAVEPDAAPPGTPAAAPPPPPADATLVLGAMIKRIAAVSDPAQKASLAALARDAQTKLAGGASIKAELVAIKSALDAASAGNADVSKAANGPAEMLTKSSTLWRGTRTQMRGKLDKLKAAILDTYADEKGIQAAVQQNLGALDKVFETLDDRLDAALDKATAATDTGERLKFLAETRTIIDEYTKKVAGDDLIVQLDANPFGVDMKFRDTLDKVLPALSGLSAARP